MSDATTPSPPPFRAAMPPGIHIYESAVFASMPVDSPVYKDSTNVFAMPRGRELRDRTPLFPMPPIPTIANIPLLAIALAPCVPLEIGTPIYVNLLGPPEGDSPETRTRGTKDAGIEGRIIAARVYDPRTVEVVVLNEGWSLADLVALRLKVVPGITVGMSTIEALNRTGLPVGWDIRPTPDGWATCRAGSTPGDAHVAYIVTQKDAQTRPPFRYERRDGKARLRQAVEGKMWRALGGNWVEGALPENNTQTDKQKQEAAETDQRLGATAPRERLVAKAKQQMHWGI
ncbi:hypothetical protein C2E23DRAFT_855806 [Lenzites betulinus]|nr:hypothetical protein C2E23DRAFT_855806 [Lenzites betulinus]